MTGVPLPKDQLPPDDDDFLRATPPPESRPKVGRWKNVLRGRGSILVIVVGSLAIVTFFVSALMAGGNQLPQSKLPDTPNMGATPGLRESSPARMKALTDENNERAERVLAQGQGSTVPTPGLAVLQPAQEPVKLSAKFATESTEAKAAQQQQQQQSENLRLAAMKNQMATLLKGWSARKSPGVNHQERQQASASAGGGAASSTGGITSPGSITPANASTTAGRGPGDLPYLMVEPGHIDLGRTALMSRSNLPGAPMKVDISSGKFAGGVLLANVAKANDLATLRFTTLTLPVGHPAVPAGGTFAVDAIAIDPKTGLGGIASDVEYRWGEQIVLKLGAAFLSGVSTVLSQPDNSVTALGAYGGATQLSGNYTTKNAIFGGLANVSKGVVDDLERRRDAEQLPIVTVAPNEDIGILWLASARAQQ